MFYRFWMGPALSMLANLIRHTNFKKRWSAFTILFIVTLLFTGILIPVPASAVPPGTETRISYSESDCPNIHPTSDNGWIVWEESCTVQRTIKAYNYNTAVQLTLPNATLFAHAPNMKGNRVVWYETTAGGLTDIYYTDLNRLPPVSHRLALPDSVKDHPVVEGNTVVWQESRPPGTTHDIMLFNISSSRLYNLTPDTDASEQEYPSIAGGRVFWQDERDGEKDIYYNDTADWSLHSIPAATPAGVSYNRPSADRNTVVWYDDSTSDVLMSNLTTTSTIDSDGNEKINPSVCSTYVVWKEDTSGIGIGPFDAILFNTTDAVKETIADSSVPADAAIVRADPDDAPVIITPDSRILWVDERNTNPDIYMFTYGPATTCPIVQFSADKTEGDGSLKVHFTDTSLQSPLLWRWDFGDGSYAAGNSVDHTFNTNGIYRVHLTAATPYCRNTTPESMVATISVGVPHVGFSANITEGIAPLPVAFNSTGTNNPAGWAWTFGDGGTSTLQNPVHTYPAGKYSVLLTANNTIGNGTKTRSGYITSLNGLQISSFMAIPGISITEGSAGQQLNLTKARIPSNVLSPDRKTLILQPPYRYGWQNISFLSRDRGGFTDTPAAITGTIDAIIFQTNDTVPTIFTGTVGNNLPINHQFRTSRWDAGKSLKTQIWQSESPSDEPDFQHIIQSSNFSTKNVAYTMTLIRGGIRSPSSAMLNLSVASAWETGSGDIASERPKTFVIAEGINASGDKVGVVIPAIYVRNDTALHIEYFLAEVPSNYSFMNKFALAKLAGSGNPFQLITLTVASHVPPPDSPVSDNPGTGSDNSGAAGGGGKGGAGQSAQVNPEKAEAVPVDPGKTAALYTNPNGVITQETSLKSNDGLATVTIGQGITAKDSAGKPVPSISIASLLPAEVPSLPDSQVISFAGRAYELHPDGAVFSPGITLSFTIPQAQWGRDYSIRVFDHATGTWQELPGSFDAKTGTITATVTHFCCFALFEKEIVPSAAATGENSSPGVTAKTQVKPPPSSAVSIFFGMVMWVADTAVKHTVFIAVIIIAFAATYAAIVVHRKRKGI